MAQGGSITDAASVQNIADAFAERLRDGTDALRDTAGTPGAIELPLSATHTVELGLNPHHGPYLRLRAQLDHIAIPERDALLEDLVRSTASSRFKTGWISGLERENWVSLTASIDPTADRSAINDLIDQALTRLDPLRFKDLEPRVDAEEPDFSSWLPL